MKINKPTLRFSTLCKFHDLAIKKNASVQYVLKTMYKHKDLRAMADEVGVSVYTLRKVMRFVGVEMRRRGPR